MSLSTAPLVAEAQEGQKALYQSGHYGVWNVSTPRLALRLNRTCTLAPADPLLPLFSESNPHLTKIAPGISWSSQPINKKITFGLYFYASEFFDSQHPNCLRRLTTKMFTCDSYRFLLNRITDLVHGHVVHVVEHEIYDHNGRPLNGNLFDFYLNDPSRTKRVEHPLVIITHETARRVLTFNVHLQSVAGTFRCCRMTNVRCRSFRNLIVIVANMLGVDPSQYHVIMHGKAQNGQRLLVDKENFSATDLCGPIIWTLKLQLKSIRWEESMLHAIGVDRKRVHNWMEPTKNEQSATPKTVLLTTTRPKEHTRRSRRRTQPS